MGQVTIHIGSRNDPVERVEDPRKLPVVLDELCRQHPNKHILARIVNENGDELMLGLGPRAGIATLTPASQDAVYNALGDPVFLQKQLIVEFYWGGHCFEMGPENLIPTPVARQIAVRWMTSGTRDETVKWETCCQRRRENGTRPRKQPERADSDETSIL